MYEKYGRKEFKDERDNKVIAAWRNGILCKVIAAMYNISEPTLHAILRRRGIYGHAGRKEHQLELFE